MDTKDSNYVYDVKNEGTRQRRRGGRITIVSSGGHAPPAPPERSAKLDVIEDRLRAADTMDASRMVGGGGSRFNGHKNSRLK